MIAQIKMSLIVDKYHPTRFSDMTLHSEINARLEKMIQNGLFLNMLFYGPTGAGKRTRIIAILRSIYGKEVMETRSQNVELKIRRRRAGSSNSNSGNSSGYVAKRLEINIVYSSCHIEITPSDVGTNDHLIISSVVKEMMQANILPLTRADAKEATPTSSSSSKLTSANLPLSNKTGTSVTLNNGDGSSSMPKTIILHNAEKLTMKGQQALRRMLERHHQTCRFILICENIASIIKPITSRCPPIRIPRPSKTQLLVLLMKIAKLEKIAIITNSTAALDGNDDDDDALTDALEKIVERSECNVRKALLMLSSLAKTQAQAQVSKSTTSTDASASIDLVTRSTTSLIDQAMVELAGTMLRKQDVEQMMMIRGKLNKLLEIGMPPGMILKKLVKILFAKTGHEGEICSKIVELAALYQHAMCTGTRPIFQLEAFIVDVMKQYALLL